MSRDAWKLGRHHCASDQNKGFRDGQLVRLQVALHLQSKSLLEAFTVGFMTSLNVVRPRSIESCLHCSWFAPTFH